MSQLPDVKSAGFVVLGEVRTGLISHHSALTRAEAERLLAQLAPGEQVLSWERPIAYSLSAPIVTGVDCGLALGPQGAKTARAIGTLSARAALTGGTILQCSAVASVTTATSRRREPWSHYIARPGVLETLASPKPEQVAEGFLSEGGKRTGVADFGAVCDRLARRIQNFPMLQGTAPLLFQWTHLRWAVTVSEDSSRDPESNGGDIPASALLRLSDGTARTLRANVSRSSVAEIVDFCSDLALHDWILTTVIRRTESLSGAGVVQDLSEIRPVVSRLLHLWMPAARVNTELSRLWSEFEGKPGFTRQWQSLVARIRDQLALHIALRNGVLIHHD